MVELRIGWNGGGMCGLNVMDFWAHGLAAFMLIALTPNSSFALTPWTILCAAAGSYVEDDQWFLHDVGASTRPYV